MHPRSPDVLGVALLWEVLSREVNAQMETYSHKGRAAILDRWHLGVPGSEARGQVKATVETEPWAGEQGAQPLCLPDPVLPQGQLRLMDGGENRLSAPSRQAVIHPGALQRPGW